MTPVQTVVNGAPHRRHCQSTHANTNASKFTRSMRLDQTSRHLSAELQASPARQQQQHTRELSVLCRTTWPDSSARPIVGAQAISHGFESHQLDVLMADTDGCSGLAGVPDPAGLHAEFRPAEPEAAESAGITSASCTSTTIAASVRQVEEQEGQTGRSKCSSTGARGA